MYLNVFEGWSFVENALSQTLYFHLFTICKWFCTQIKCIRPLSTMNFHMVFQRTISTKSLQENCTRVRFNTSVYSWMSFKMGICGKRFVTNCTTEVTTVEYHNSSLPQNAACFLIYYSLERKESKNSTQSSTINLK